jgi:hypothetical protein
LAFTIDITGAEDLCSDDMIRDLLEEVVEFPDTIFDSARKLDEARIMAKSWLESRTGRYLLFRDIENEKIDGNDRLYLSVSRPPILSVTSLIVDDVEKVLGTDFWIFPEYLAFAVPVPRGHENVRISYRSGTGESIHLSTARVIARVVAKDILKALASGSAESSSITVGPISLKESFRDGVRYKNKLGEWDQEIEQWITSSSGCPFEAVGYQRHHQPLPRVYIPRKDAWE